MAATREAQRLTEAHRLAQARLGARTAATVLDTWNLLDLDDLDGTFDRWLRTVLPLLRAQHGASAQLAANYVDLFKKLELGASARAPVVLAALDAEAATTSLLVTGPVSVKSAMTRGLTVPQAAEVARVKVAGTAMRLALDGGRGTLLDTHDADRQMIGYARVTSGSPCAFCAMVASRGPVYKSKSSATSVVGRQGFAEETRGVRETRRGGNLSRQGFGESKVRTRGSRALGQSFHDHCGCSAEPVYRDDADWPPGSRRFREIYDKAAEGTYGSGENQLQRFRKALAEGAN